MKPISKKQKQQYIPDQQTSIKGKHNPSINSQRVLQNPDVSKLLYKILSQITKQNIVKMLATLSLFIQNKKLCNILQNSSIIVKRHNHKNKINYFYEVIYANQDNYVVMPANNDQMDCTCSKYVRCLFGEGKCRMCQHIAAVKIIQNTGIKQIVMVPANKNIDYINTFRIKSYI